MVTVPDGTGKDRVEGDFQLPETSEEAKSIIEGAGKDQPIIFNERGGGQSDIPYRFDLISGLAMAEMAKVLKDGAEKYGENNWMRISIDSHLNHALMHIFAHLAGDTSDDHLSHMLCRATFAVHLQASDSK